MPPDPLAGRIDPWRALDGDAPGAAKENGTSIFSPPRLLRYGRDCELETRERREKDALNVRISHHLTATTSTSSTLHSRLWRSAPV